MNRSYLCDWKLPALGLTVLALLAPAQADEPVQWVKPATVVEWQNISGGGKTFRADGISWTIHPLEAKTGEEPAFAVTVRIDNAPYFQHVFTAVDPNVQFVVGRFDPTAAQPQLILSTHTGGELCCASRAILLHRTDGWQVVSLPGGAYDGDLAAPQDIDGDGAADFVLTDDRFAYAFDNFADSWLPPRVFRLRDGALEEESADRRFDALYRRDREEAQTFCARRKLGACAAFVADAIRLGELETGWKFLSTHCGDAGFPAALARFLVKNDYLIPAQAERLAPPAP